MATLDNDDDDAYDRRVTFMHSNQVDNDDDDGSETTHFGS